MQKFLAMNPGLAEEPIEGTTAVEPAFGLPAQWIEASTKDRAEMLGYTVVDPSSVVATHLTEVIRRHAPSVLSRQDVQNLLASLKEDTRRSWRTWCRTCSRSARSSRSCKTSWRSGSRFAT